MALVQLDGDAITSWDAFHDVCAREFGFPGFYGRNMNAWIDCLTYIGEGDGMSRFVLQPGEVLRIEVSNSESLRKRVPEVLAELIACTNHVNDRFTEAGDEWRLELVLR